MEKYVEEINCEVRNDFGILCVVCVGEWSGAGVGDFAMVSLCAHSFHSACSPDQQCRKNNRHHSNNTGSLCVCVCGCVQERERAREFVYLCLSVCVCVGVCVREGERG